MTKTKKKKDSKQTRASIVNPRSTVSLVQCDDICGRSEYSDCLSVARNTVMDSSTKCLIQLYHHSHFTNVTKCIKIPTYQHIMNINQS